MKHVRKIYHFCLEMRRLIHWRNLIGEGLRNITEADEC